MSIDNHDANIAKTLMLHCYPNINNPPPQSEEGDNHIQYDQRLLMQALYSTSGSLVRPISPGNCFAAYSGS